MNHATRGFHEANTVTAVAAAPNGEIFDLEGYAAVGMAGNRLQVLTPDDTIDMPHGSELMLLPDRHPIVFNFDTLDFEVLTRNPFEPGEPILAVGAFNSPGHVNRLSCAYDDSSASSLLPLFSYGAAGFLDQGFRSAAICVDKEPRQDLRQMPLHRVKNGVDQMRNKYPSNRLIRHIEHCALSYGCPAGKNFFLKRYEAPLPTAQACNARCLGCISLQPDPVLSACQNRIDFTPSPGEIAELALEHITRVKHAVVSFGQGCEGDPLTAFDVIEPAVRQIRDTTDKGSVNMNTNASMPDKIERLCRSGLDAIRVSMNSTQESHYTAYFRPRSYSFQDVLASIDRARTGDAFVAVNYLNCPGFTDTEDEFNALHRLIKTHDINMIQWRNLNYDPKAYLKKMEQVQPLSAPLGMGTIIERLKKDFPDLIHGYFNPPKERYRKAGL
ncbi:MAG: radical SAM protein [Desulfobacteraceae bacterium]|nr:MAG: radical SAM protein [Desulfobacteraceae bacterium]